MCVLLQEIADHPGQREPQSDMGASEAIGAHDSHRRHRDQDEPQVVSAVHRRVPAHRELRHRRLCGHGAAGRERGVERVEPESDDDDLVSDFVSVVGALAGVGGRELEQ